MGEMEQLSLFMDGDIRGLMDYPYCPACKRAMKDYDNQCDLCGQFISWERWREYLMSEGEWKGENSKDN